MNRESPAEGERRQAGRMVIDKCSQSTAAGVARFLPFLLLHGGSGSVKALVRTGPWRRHQLSAALILNAHGATEAFSRPERALAWLKDLLRHPPNVFNHLAGWNWFGHCRGLPSPHLHSVVVVSSRSRFLHPGR